MKIATTLLLIFIGFNGMTQELSFSDTIPRLKSVKTVQHILFDFDKPVLRPESYIYLDSLVEYMKWQNQIIIEIGNHGDSRGSESYCVRLTQSRAQAMSKYLISKGISPKRVVPTGYGETKLLIPDSSIDVMKDAEEIEKAHQLNRRTTYKIIALDYVSKPVDEE